MNDAYAALVAFDRQRTLVREKTLAAVQSLGAPTTRQVADALGITSGPERNRLRSRLQGYARQGYLRCGRAEGYLGSLTTWQVVR